MSLNYTALTGPIVRGGRWPPADGNIRVILTRTQDGAALNWPIGADAWTWQLRISRDQWGGTPDLTLAAASVSLSNNVITLLFYATEAQTATLPSTDKRRYWIQVRSVDGTGEDGFYATGRAHVESPVAQL